MACSNSAKPDCCKKDVQNKNNVFLAGIIYGLLPHIGCIAFIIASVLGVTVATKLFKPLLLNPHFFYYLILLSFIFATISALIYLKKQGFINFNNAEDGFEINFTPGIIKRKWKYLSAMYGSTIGINLLLFFVIFPSLANVSLGVAADSKMTGAFLANWNRDANSLIKLKVDIPCPGHAPLISGELKSLEGVLGVQFSFPNIFTVKYDNTKTSKQEILSLDVFKTYKATVLSESNALQGNQQINTKSNNISSGCCRGSSCSGLSGAGCCGSR